MGDPPKEFLTICVPCLLKVALNRKEDKDIQKEVEMALLALSSIYDHYEIERELYLNEIKEIIKYHQEHRNLTRLAYQSAWGLLVNQSRINRSLDDVVINELHFVRDAARELGELTKCVNLKREEKTEEIRQMNEAETIMMKWIKTVEAFYLHLRSWKEEYAELISYLAKLARAMRESEREIYRSLTSAFQLISTWKIFRIDAMRKCGVVDLFLEEIQQNTSDDMITYDCMMFYRVFSRRLRENDDEGYSEVGWEETKREVLQKMEEIGCEDIITSFQKIYASIL
ncbi:uncharacterized protein MONOS_1871 [Monocercomonoides exilis]|uniref:uncharacterized protein n=1 Tax=Monocercomonoides exilis TaxID=2049356 RepID=UPI0035594FFB|nr:hypothetical protein MONOS_1871 [Monocercomonoides exilis]|eukprot:MONOS_1871.1-p1 / transcript=MONOS_1871.1 / gene=MONOS_1871 / organism=Monocercomonoides_exilis_PA203 / gene_product=unspecified product / transcript_product=unspecified product / location=Mono_scaffold00035:140647-141562(-) / protein_length=285 / sequence_SO=supercontig / SO=protein_coding / is_pseudo=false